MFRGVDAAGVGNQPQTNNKIWIAFYFIFLIIISNFLILNFFVGVVMETFSKEKARRGGYFLLTKSQRKWCDIQTEIMRMNPQSKFKRPKDSLRKSMYNFMQKKAFRWIEFALILLVILPFFMTQHRAGDSYNSFVDIFVTITYVVFIIEQLVKLFAVGCQVFKKSGFVFDVVMIILEAVSFKNFNSVRGWYLKDLQPGMVFNSLQIGKIANSNDEFVIKFPTIIRILLTIRIFRVVKLAPYVKNSDVIFDIYSFALPMLLSVMLLLASVMYIYAVIGIHFFSYIKWRDGINVDANFVSFFQAIITLIRISTAEGWNSLLNDCVSKIRSNDLCFDIRGYQDFEFHNREFVGCGSSFAFVYFLTFMIIFVYLLVNLIVAVIVETFFLKARLANAKVNSKILNKFLKVWQKYDRQGRGVLSYTKVNIPSFSIFHPFSEKKCKFSNFGRLRR